MTEHSGGQSLVYLYWDEDGGLNPETILHRLLLGTIKLIWA